MGTFNFTEGASARGQRTARNALKTVAGIAVGAASLLALNVAQPAFAASGTGDAEKLRRMDIMLMVTGLRCRTTVDNFIPDYGRFTSRHMGELNAANRELKDQFARELGPKGAERALDKMSVVMANEYGGGHPWLNCSELRQVTKSLAAVQGRATLVEAANQLLDHKPTPLLALAGR